MQLKAAAVLLVFYCTLSSKAYILNEDGEPAIVGEDESLKEVKPTGTIGDEESPKDVEPTGTMGDEESPKEVEPTGTMGDEESPKEVEPTGTMGDEESPKEVEPTGTMGDEESPKEVEPTGTMGDEESPKEVEPTGTMGDEENPKEVEPAGTVGDEENPKDDETTGATGDADSPVEDQASFLSDLFDTKYPVNEGMSQMIAVDSVDVQNEGSDANDVSAGLDLPQEAAPPLECRSYRTLSEYHRAQGYKGLVVTCDNKLTTGWYRITGLAGYKMPESCVPKLQCGTHAPGWLVGGHPTVAQGAVFRKVCFHWSSSCCHWSRYIRVRNCGLFYVYYLTKPPTCNLRYCGNRGPVIPAECKSYKYLSEGDRAQGYKGVVKCDKNLAGWYRITGLAGYKMPESCVPKLQCGTHAPGWLVGGHPTVAQGAVSRKVCFHWSSSCCHWSRYIRVRNCGPFYVYYLTKPPTCNLRYCGNRRPVIPAECRSYKYLNEYDRAQGFSGVVKCDSNLAGWYRITGRAGYKMPDSCVLKRQCGTHAPGWLVGGHPTVAQGAVSRKVCFHWSRGCCQWSKYIRVRNCGLFYVYYLTKPPACSLRYCGNRLPAPVPSECTNYKILSESDRAVRSTGVLKCDRNLAAGWYRFNWPAGYQMPESCVPIRKCGTHAPGWLVGGHPTKAQGSVLRSVCFNWSSNCCRWRRYIRVRNCGAYYVYYLSGTPVCQLRYCGNQT